MNSECESHLLRAGRERGAAEGNCVAARRGGEQPEAEGRSRTQVNSIRPPSRASQLANGEASRASGKPVPVRGLPILATGRDGGGWSENDPKGTGVKWRDLPACQERRPAGGRASIVARKPGNAGGAKGRRKTNRPKTNRGIRLRLLPEGHKPDRLSSGAPEGVRGTRTVGGEQPGDGPLALGAKRSVVQSSLWPCPTRSDLSSPRGSSSIGEPDAGDPPVRFGGRGGASQCPVPTPIHTTDCPAKPKDRGIRVVELSRNHAIESDASW